MSVNRGSWAVKEEVSYYLVRGVFFTLSLFPSSLRRLLFKHLFQTFFALHGRYRSIIMKNLSLVFPDKGESWKGEFLEKHAEAMARSIDDLFITVSPEWVKDHIRFDERAELELEQGALFFTGHLGSFELLARVVPLIGGKTGFVVRAFPNQKLNDWWQGMRAANGNLVIERNGALRKMIRGIQSSYKIGVLFDQNVTRKHAIFVNHFGRTAATTFAPAHVALHTQCPVYVITIRPEGRHRHVIKLSKVPVEDLYRDESLSKDEKIRIITERATKEFEARVLDYPEGWFWLHRRWKTAPEGMPEDFYS